ncbi:MAG: GNAT family N-acetyltransferase [Acidimicrobiales bacterium]
MDIEVRPLAVSDIPAVCEIQAGAYRDSSFHESPETFAAYLRAFPAGSLAAVADHSLVGYGVGHPWLKGVPPPLDLTELELPTTPTCFHVHDISVQVKGVQLGTRLLRQLVKVAADEQLEFLDLIAVQGADTYWHQFGFRPSEPETQAAKALYGSTAVYMFAPIVDHGLPRGARPE